MSLEIVRQSLKFIITSPSTPHHRCLYESESTWHLSGVKNVNNVEVPAADKMMHSTRN